MTVEAALIFKGVLSRPALQLQSDTNLNAAIGRWHSLELTVLAPLDHLQGFVGDFHSLIHSLLNFSLRPRAVHAMHLRLQRSVSTGGRRQTTTTLKATEYAAGPAQHAKKTLALNLFCRHNALDFDFDGGLGLRCELPAVQAHFLQTATTLNLLDVRVQVSPTAIVSRSPQQPPLTLDLPAVAVSLRRATDEAGTSAAPMAHTASVTSVTGDRPARPPSADGNNATRAGEDRLAEAAGGATLQQPSTSSQPALLRRDSGNTGSVSHQLRHTHSHLRPADSNALRTTLNFFVGKMPLDCSSQMLSHLMSVPELYAPYARDIAYALSAASGGIGASGQSQRTSATSASQAVASVRQDDRPGEQATDGGRRRSMQGLVAPRGWQLLSGSKSGDGSPRARASSLSRFRDRLAGATSGGASAAPATATSAAATPFRLKLAMDIDGHFEGIDLVAESSQAFALLLHTGELQLRGHNTVSADSEQLQLRGKLKPVMVFGSAMDGHIAALDAAVGPQPGYAQFCCEIDLSLQHSVRWTTGVSAASAAATAEAAAGTDTAPTIPGGTSPTTAKSTTVGGASATQSQNSARSIVSVVVNQPSIFLPPDLIRPAALYWMEYRATFNLWEKERQALRRKMPHAFRKERTVGSGGVDIPTDAGARPGQPASAPSASKMYISLDVNHMNMRVPLQSEMSGSARPDHTVPFLVRRTAAVLTDTSFFFFSKSHTFPFSLCLAYLFFYS